MTTTTTQEEGYVIYTLSPEPFPEPYPSEPVERFNSEDKKFATTICLFTTITSVVLICLFFLIGHSFGYILLIILLVLSVALLICYWVRRPALIFGIRRTTSVKIPNYALHIIPAPQLKQINNNVMNSSNSGYYVYPYPTNIKPPPVYTHCKSVNT